MDEIFSFQMTSTEDGPGRGGVMQHGYDLTDENKKIWDEVNVIEENNTAVALPTGYHTTVALPAPGVSAVGPGRRYEEVQGPVRRAVFLA